MSRDPLLTDLAGEWADEAEELYAAVGLGLVAEAPQSGLRARLLDAVAPVWNKFGAELAQLIDLPVMAAAAILAKAESAVSWVDGPLRGVSLLHIEAGPACAGADVGLVRLGAGVSFPMHDHLGEERVVILDGYYDDASGYRMAAGDSETRRPGESHSFTAGPDGVVFVVVLREGIQFGDGTIYRG